MIYYSMDNVADGLNQINQTLRDLIEAVKKPKENRFMRVLEILVLVGGASAIIGGIDIVIKWLLGG